MPPHNLWDSYNWKPNFKYKKIVTSYRLTSFIHNEFKYAKSIPDHESLKLLENNYHLSRYKYIHVRFKAAVRHSAAQQQPFPSNTFQLQLKVYLRAIKK